MNFAECLMAAVNSGDLDPERAKMAVDEWTRATRKYEQQGMSPANARQQAADDMIARITKAEIRQRHIVARQLEVLQRNQARYAKADPDLLSRDIEHVEREGKAIAKMAFGGMRDFLRDHAEDLFGRVRNRAQLMDITRELHGEDSGNIAAKQIAASVNKQREWLRTSFNSLGGDIGKLDDYGLRHSHNRGKITAVGYDAWSADIAKRLDWNRIENFKTGKPFAPKKGVVPHPEDVEAFLRPIYDDITSRGWVDRTPGFGVGAKALFNSGAEARVLHFKSADDWMAYNDSFGSENAFQAITGEFTSRATDIARMRAFGPNPKAGIENAIQVMEKAAHLAPRNKNTGTVASRAVGYGLQPEDVVATTAERARVMHGLLSGEMNQPANEAMATLMIGARNLLTAAQLGSATLSQVSDLPSMRAAAKAMGMSPNNPVKNLMELITNGLDAKMAGDLGFILDSWANASATQARYLGDVWRPEITGRISNFVLKANGMTAITDRERVAIAMAFGSDLADMAGKSWDDLNPNLRVFMENRGIGANDWDLLRDPSVIYTDARGGKHLNPNWFMEKSSLPMDQRQDLAIRFGALFEAHQEMALPSSSLRGTAWAVGRSKPGSFNGELIRSFKMYKSFSLSVMFNQSRRVREIQGGIGAKAWYVGGLMASLTVAGAISIQLKEIAKGRDPRPMNTLKFWGAAFMQGGGLGIFGDFFSASTSRTGGGFGEVLAGPVFGAMGDVSRFVGTNLSAAANGKDTHFGRDAVNLARRYNPAATLLPTRLALDRVVWDQLQELIDPDAADDYLRIERKLKREQGTQSWWQRGEALPSRAPDLSNIIGGGA